MRKYNINSLILIIGLFIFNLKVLAQQEEVKIIEKETINFSSIRTELTYSFTEIESVDGAGAKLRLLSQSNMGIAVGYTEHWNSHNTTHIKAAYNSVVFKTPETSSIENTNLSLISFGIGHTYSFSEKLRLNAGFYLTEDVYIRAKSVTVLTLDKFLNPSIKGDLEYDFLEINNFKLGGSANLEVSAPFTAERYESTEGNYEVNTAFGSGATIYARKFLKGYSIEGNLFYRNKSAKTSITNQTTTNQGIGLRIAIPFGY